MAEKTWPGIDYEALEWILLNLFNPLTHGLFEVRYLTACGMNRPQICGRISPQP
jgi:hypothetical protein